MLITTRYCSWSWSSSARHVIAPSTGFGWSLTALFYRLNVIYVDLPWYGFNASVVLRGCVLWQSEDQKCTLNLGLHAPSTAKPVRNRRYQSPAWSDGRMLSSEDRAAICKCIFVRQNQRLRWLPEPGQLILCRGSAWHAPSNTFRFPSRTLCSGHPDLHLELIPLCCPYPVLPSTLILFPSLSLVSSTTTGRGVRLVPLWWGT